MSAGDSVADDPTTVSLVDDPLDVLVLDVRLPDGSGIQIGRGVRSPVPPATC